MAESDPQRWNDEFYRNGRLVLRTARGRVTLLLLVCIVFTGAGIQQIGAGGARNRFEGILAVVLIGVLVIPALGWRLVTGRPVTVVEPQGVAVDSVRLGWDEILGIRVSGRRNRLVLLDITSEAHQRLSAERSWWQRGWHPSFALPNVQGVDPEMFAAWLGWLHAGYTNQPPPG